MPIAFESPGNKIDYKNSPEMEKLMYLLRDIEKFIRETKMPWTKFGRLSVRDPRFVEDLRNGRQPGKKISLQVEHFMNKWHNDHADG